ncbi:hypothetical protein RVS70_05435 [Virgibacillus sp. M23]|uniref:hypothetical protein n=1 Tax=Virgibacillus sp. M23 TaxID=3079030 RepID=UPI002A91C1AA|nr:hypothetical protein [Virgibacillus sp. M23]MDY7043644.1 hypothetical protein [Virgibacillus sp. M23]
MRKKIKIYTPDHEERLRRQREKRHQRKLEERKVKAIERNKEYLDSIGYGQEKIFLVLGNTYSIKENLKDAGARFSRQLNGWFFTKDNQDYDTVDLETKKLIEYNDIGEASLAFRKDTLEYIKSRINFNKPKSNYIGEVGDKVELELIFLASFIFEHEFGATFINKLQDLDGNIAVWKTGKI